MNIQIGNSYHLEKIKIKVPKKPAINTKLKNNKRKIVNFTYLNNLLTLKTMKKFNNINNN